MSTACSGARIGRKSWSYFMPMLWLKSNGMPVMQGP
eukprot:SAG25_NODE_1203_length_3627_cov_2.127834_3_plen_36_part_00